MSTKPPADPSMERSATPVRPATAPAPTPRKPAAPPPKSGGFQRFVLQFLLLVIALGGAFGTGYLVNANEMQLNRNDLLQQQLDAQERILALEKQIAELQERRESGNRVELDLTEVFEPIREAVGRIALVRMGEISREITTELTRLVEDNRPALDEPANATGSVSPGGMNEGSAVTDQTPEAASAAGEMAPSAGDGGRDPLQPDSAALGAAESPPDQPEAIEMVGSEPEGTLPSIKRHRPRLELSPSRATTGRRRPAPGPPPPRRGVRQASLPVAPASIDSPGWRRPDSPPGEADPVGDEVGTTSTRRCPPIADPDLPRSQSAGSRGHDRTVGAACGGRPPSPRAAIPDRVGPVTRHRRRVVPRGPLRSRRMPA